MLKYYTGGKGLPGGMSLGEFHASAAHVNDPQGAPPYVDPATGQFFTNLTPIAAGSITLSELGAVGSDGALYTALPGNATKVVTPRVGGDNFYAFNLTATNHILTITANGYDLSVTNPEFCVGQRVNFAPMFSPPLTSVASEVSHWTLGGNYVNHSSQANSHSSVHYDVSSALLLRTNTYAWWLSAGAASATFAVNVTFNNGTQEVLTRRGSFTIGTPTISNFVRYSPFQPVIEDAYLRLGFFPDGTATNSGRMSFSAQINSRYSGQADFTQLISGNFTNNGSVNGPGSGFQLDTSLFYVGGNQPAFAVGAASPSNTVWLNDSPGVHLFMGNPVGCDLTYAS